MYGLKQAPRQWYKKFESFILEHGVHKTQADHCVFVKRYECEAQKNREENREALEGSKGDRYLRARV